MSYDNEKMGEIIDEQEYERIDLNDKIDDLITCQICLEWFQSAGERIPCKLKCPHIMCKKCAESWLKKVNFYYSSEEV